MNSDPESIGFARVRERPADGLPAVVHPGWSERFPWLVQGTTAGARLSGGARLTGDGRLAGARAPDTDADLPEMRVSGADAGFDLGLFAGAHPGADVPARWERLRAWTGADTVVHARQVHGAEVRFHGDGVGPGLHIVPPCDGHATARAGLLLAVSLADCAPVSIVDARRQVIALVHAGWRGTAAGILEEGIAAVLEGRARGFGAAPGIGDARPGDLDLHIGPAICGACYEVGGEVFEALGRTRPPEPTPIDLPGILADRAARAGVDLDRITVSEHCTRCGPLDLYSHRRGDAGRHVAFLGIRP